MLKSQIGEDKNESPKFHLNNKNILSDNSSKSRAISPASPLQFFKPAHASNKIQNLVFDYSDIDKNEKESFDQWYFYKSIKYNDI